MKYFATFVIFSSLALLASTKSLNWLQDKDLRAQRGIFSAIERLLNCAVNSLANAAGSTLQQLAVVVNNIINIAGESIQCIPVAVPNTGTNATDLIAAIRCILAEFLNGNLLDVFISSPQMFIQFAIILLQSGIGCTLEAILAIFGIQQ